MDRNITIEGGILRVDGDRQLLRAAEIHNSSSSTRSAITASFERVAGLGADTVLAPVAWDLLEPEEGVFDFDLIDCMTEVAEKLNLDLVPLWFGSWKNASSSYVPRWVKLDPTRFPRAETTSGPVEVLSPFSQANVAADANAFSSLMRRLAETGSSRVTMVQVENEVGLLRDSRDRGPDADAEWNRAVPERMLRLVEDNAELACHDEWLAAGAPRQGSWHEIFGDSERGGEAFMAFGFSRYVDQVAAAGAQWLKVPMFVNAWLDADATVEGTTDEAAVALGGGQRPGAYPSGGPVLGVAEIWQEFAPSLSFLAPDIYFGDFEAFARDYARRNSALFIPEMRRDSLGAAQMFAAIGEYRAIGASVFGADSFRSLEESVAITDAYALLQVLADSLKVYPQARTHGFCLTAERPAVSCTFGDLTVEVTTEDPFGIARPTYPAYLILAEEAPGRVLALGRGVSIRCHRFGAPLAVLTADELGTGNQLGHVVRRLGGDETAAGSGIQFMPLGGGPGNGSFPIPGIAEFTGAVRIEFYAPVG